MAAAKPPRRVKFFVGMLGGDPDLFARAKQLLTRAWGAADSASPCWDWSWTDYYHAEMGPDLRRQFISFQDLGMPDRLVELKRLANDLETRIGRDCLASAGQRPVNLDPGYLTSAKLVLASMKDHAHRIYLGQGVHAEVTLTFEHNAWKALPWTYPDYGSPEYHAYFADLRAAYKQQAAEMPREGGTEPADMVPPQ